MKFKILPLVLLGAFSFLWNACSKDDVAGTATDTENTIAGVVKNSSGFAASKASVRMIANTASFGTSAATIETLTNEKGEFAFDSTVADTINLLVRLADSTEISFENSVVAALAKDVEISLAKPGLLKGSFDYAEHLDEVTVGSGFKLSVLGTGIEIPVLAGDSFNVALPAGDFKVAFAPNDELLIQKLRELGYADTLIYQELNVGIKAGDTLNLGDIHWVMGEKFQNNWKNGSVLKGYVVNDKRKGVPGAKVQLITDTYGLNYARDIPTFVVQALTDSTGYWELPFPSEKAVIDSFRVEAILPDKGEMAESRFVMPSELKANEGRSISLDTLKLTLNASMHLDVHLVINKDDETQIDNCHMNGVVIGIVGSSWFTKIVTCDRVLLQNLPAGLQTFVMYTSDLPVLNMLMEQGATPESYMTFVTKVGLAPNDTLSPQGVTYTPPTL